MSTNACLKANWPAPANIRAFTTLRSGPGVSRAPFDRFNLGSRCGDDPAHAQQNRERLASGFRLPTSPRWLHQVHGVDVVRLGKRSDRDRDLEPIADAAVSSDAGVVLAILTADCLPVLLCAEQGDEVAAAHAGWRGLAAGVLENTVRAMYSPPPELMAWLGPAAGPDAYEVGSEVREAFLAHDRAAASAFVPTRENHWRVDLYQLARQRLKAIGVTRVFGGGLCTISDPTHYYSHRRDQTTGRMATVIWRNNE
jgi:YfiH family protein